MDQSKIQFVQQVVTEITKLAEAINALSVLLQIWFDRGYAEKATDEITDANLVADTANPLYTNQAGAKVVDIRSAMYFIDQLVTFLKPYSATINKVRRINGR